jgi:uncharacterized protein YbaA (DUF1428 family)
MTYVDGYVIPVPQDKRDQYFEVARAMAPIFIECGALQVMECWGDDLKHGNHTDFFMAVKAEADENVVFSFVIWPSREARDAGNAKVMADPRMDSIGMTDSFDGKRLILGGFETVVDTSQEN